MFSIKKTILLVCTFGALLDVASAAQCSNNNDNNPPDIYYFPTTKEKPVFCPKEYWTILDSHPITFKKQPQGDTWLVVGNTGTGISTIVNYALGHGLTKVKLKDIQNGKVKPIGIDAQPKKARNHKVVVVTKKKESHNIAPIGIVSAKSCTVIPALYPTYIDDVLLLDCPGFETTQGMEQKLFNMLMIRSMLENATSVQTLLVVVADEDLASRGCKVFIDMLHQLLVFFPSMLDHMDQVHFLINKAIETEKEDVIDLIEDIVQRKETQLANIKKNHPDNWQKLWEQKPAFKELLLLNSIVKSATIYIVDPLDKGESWQVAYQAIQKKIKPCPSIAKDSFSLNIPGIDVVGTLTPVYDKEISTIRELVENVYATRLSIHHDTQSMENHLESVREKDDLLLQLQCIKMAKQSHNQERKVVKEVFNIKNQISHLKKNIAKSKQKLNEITHHLQSEKTKKRMHYFHNNRNLINKLFIREQIQKSLDLIKKYIEENNHQDDEKKDNQ